MRIIKQAEVGSNGGKIRLMTFSEFPEELFMPEEPDDGEAGSQEREAEHSRAAKAALEAAQREAAEITQVAREEAARMRREASDETERARRDAALELEQARAQAAADADQNMKQAYASGYSSGEQDGFKKGYEDGYGKGKNAASEEAAGAVSMMSQVIDQLKMYHTEILAESQNDIVKMALAVAEKVLHKEIMTDPTTVLAVVKNALSKVSFKKQFVIHVNPLDIEVLKGSSDEIRAVVQNHESIKFKASPQVEPGGCIVQTESGVVDAQIDRQFGEVQEAVLKAVEGEDE